MAVASRLAVGVIFLLGGVRFLVAPLDRFDEGVTLTKGMLAAAGLIPYRDFWITYGPLDTYLLAAAFRGLGTNVLVERGLAIALWLTFTVLAYRLIAYIGLRGAPRLLVTGVIAIVPLSVPALNSAFLADLIGLAAVFAFIRSLQPGPGFWPLLAGALTSLSSFARPEFAVALGIGLLAAYLLLLVPGGGRWRGHLLGFVLAAGVVGAGLWIPMLLSAGPDHVFYDLVIYAATLYPAGRTIPLGQGADGPAVLLFSAGYVVIWGWAVVSAIRHRSDQRRVAQIAALLIAGVLIFTWVRTRADAAHALNAWPLTAVLMALLLQGRGMQSRTSPGAERAIAWAGLIIFGAAIGGLVFRDLGHPAVAGALPRATAVGDRAWMPSDQLAELIQRIDLQVPPGRPIFVGLKRNDLMLFNDTAIYFLADRHPGTVYFEYLPGFSNSDSIQRKVSCQLERSGVLMVVLGPNTEGEPWNLSSKRGSTYLDDWISARATDRTVIGPYELVTLQPSTADVSSPGPGSPGSPGMPAALSGC
jgi:hypothetical protein